MENNNTELIADCRNGVCAELFISQDWYETLIEFRTKYITLTNFLLEKAELNSNGKLSIYTNVAEILTALEWLKVQARVNELKNGEEE